jgi:DNA (cytosine-5)-methyltransferase 1
MTRVAMKTAPFASEFRAVDFFCGAGGMTHGLRSAGIHVLGGIDNALQCKDSYERNNFPARFIHHDIASLRFEELSELLGIAVKDSQLIFVGCSPCQYWSKIQTSRTKSAQTAFLLKEFQRFVEYFLPGFVVLENVPGLKHNKESYLPHFLSFLESQGYYYAHGIVDASRYGVPQHRLRYLLIASRSVSSVTLPEPSENRVWVRDVLGESNGFPCIPAGHIDHTPFLHTSSALSEKNLRRIRLTPHDGGTRHSWKDDPELQINAYRGKDSIFVDVYGRMCWDRPAPTITTKFNSISNGRFGHPEEDRAISLREGACLQSFPRDYLFFDTNLQGIARQIGNAVPPLLSEKIGQHIIRMVSYGNV